MHKTITTDRGLELRKRFTGDYCIVASDGRISGEISWSEHYGRYMGYTTSDTPLQARDLYELFLMCLASLEIATERAA